MFLERLLTHPSLLADSAVIDYGLSRDQLQIRIGDIRMICGGKAGIIKDNKLIVDSKEVTYADIRIKHFQVLGENEGWDNVTELSDKKELLKLALEGIEKITNETESADHSDILETFSAPSP